MHVIFSDSRFGNIPIADAPTRYASISILHRLQSNELRVEDSFALGDFDINILVTSDRGHCKGRFRVHVDRNHLALSMTRLRRHHTITNQFIKLLTRDKKLLKLQ